ncbi:hypothetical protein U8V72_15330 [Priestia filamentosa]|uniref:hypothetical protein n=1 Tax=Priestia filamentosa TaxID=1402861 RepID=UPI0005893CAE
MLRHIFSKKTEVMFDISSKTIDDLLHVYGMYFHKYIVSTNKELHSDSAAIARKALRHAMDTYDDAAMGDFVSYVELLIQWQITLLKHNSLTPEMEKRIEAMHYVEQLKKFKVSLVAISTYRLSIPEKDVVMDIIQKITSCNELKAIVFQTKRIPLESFEYKKEKRKFVKKYEDYVMAMLLLHLYSYKHLSELLN